MTPTASKHELMRLAAKAYGIDTERCFQYVDGGFDWPGKAGRWNPLDITTGDALRLAVKLRMHINADGMEVGYRIDGVLYVKPVYVVDGSIEESICLAIVRAAAEIGKAVQP